MSDVLSFRDDFMPRKYQAAECIDYQCEHSTVHRLRFNDGSIEWWERSNLNPGGRKVEAAEMFQSYPHLMA